MEKLNLIDFFFENEAARLGITPEQLENIVELASNEELDELLGKHIISITNPNLIVIYEGHTTFICLEGLVVDVMCKSLHIYKPTKNTKCYV